MFKLLTSFLIVVATFVVPASSRAETVLMMAEEPGCIWCARWNRDIAPIYDKTGEGAAAPLRRVDISEPFPDDITVARPINFTPTFVLLVDGAEVSRLEGYPGEDFFWGLLGQMLLNNDIPFDIRQADPSNSTTGDF